MAAAGSPRWGVVMQASPQNYSALRWIDIEPQPPEKGGININGTEKTPL